MLSHITIGITDLDRSIRFYQPLLHALGLVPKFADKNWAAWKHPSADRPLFVITMPFDGKPATPGNGQMFALLAATRAVVNECHKLALNQGGTDAGKPGLRPDYHPNYYGAYVRDPDGNKLCICCHQPE